MEELEVAIGFIGTYGQYVEIGLYNGSLMRLTYQETQELISALTAAMLSLRLESIVDDDGNLIESTPPISSSDH